MAPESATVGKWDPHKVYDVSPDEKNLIEKRAERRAALKAEFQMKVTDPGRYKPGFVFDPAVQRYLSMRSKHFSHFKRTPKNFAFFVGMVLAPMTILTIGTQWDRNRFDAKCRRGEIAYKDRNFKFI